MSTKVRKESGSQPSRANVPRVPVFPPSCLPGSSCSMSVKIPRTLGGILCKDLDLLQPFHDTEEEPDTKRGSALQEVIRLPDQAKTESPICHKSMLGA